MIRSLNHKFVARSRYQIGLPSLRTARPPKTHRPYGVRRSHYTNRPSQPHVSLRRNVQASSWPTLVTGLILCGGALLVSYTFASSPPSIDLRALVKEQEETEEMVDSGPGHLGNLTAEQETKLRELWAATLKVFGVPATEDEGTDDEKTAQNAQPEGDSAKSDKTKKKRKSLFGRKKDAEKTVDAASSPGHSKHGDADDKYGQTKDFQEALASQSPEDLRSAFWGMVKHDHPDQLFLRFLRARKWDVEKALVMLISTMHWRSEQVHVDTDIMGKGEGGAAEDAKSSDHAVKKEGEDFLEQLRLGKSFLHGTDKEGRPLCFVRVRLHHQGDQSEASLERYTVYVIETARLLLAPPVETACVLFDMTHFGMNNMDYAPVKFMIKCFEANYPESLGAVLVHKAPWIFQGIWKIIRGWLDPVVASKVHFTSDVKDLEQYIDHKHIIKELGGSEDWTYKYVAPSVDENAQMKDHASRDKLIENREGTVQEFQELTHAWIAAGHMGENTEEIRRKRDALAKSLKRGYWELDPFIRARSFYDRTGVIQSGGKINFHPQPQDAPQSRDANDGQHNVGPDDVD